MKKGPFKMKGYTYPGASPMMKKEETKVTQTYGDDKITKTKDDKSSTYNKTSSEKIVSGPNKGKNKVTYTNDLGNTEVRIES